MTRIEALEDRRLMAGGGSWASDVNGDWSDATKWSGNNIPFGLGAAVVFNLDITATRTVTLDTARTIGNLEFRDTTPSNNWVIGGSQVLTLNPGLTVSTAPTIEVIDTVATIQPVVAGTKGITVLRTGSAGQVTLSGNNTYSGLTTVGVSGTSVTLRIEHGNALGASGAADKTVVTNTSRVQLAGGINTPENFDIVGTGTSGAINNSAGSNDVSGLVTLTGNASVGGGAGVGNLLRFRGGVDTGGFLFTVSGTGDFKVDSAPISGTGGLTKAGGGKLTLGDVNTYSGVTTIAGGMLEVQNREALGSTAGGVVVT
ncbi:MAG: autotransporter-associated beta strand repeat-containing protein, partial [Planctomycetaceae bacterium]